LGPTSRHQINPNMSDRVKGGAGGIETPPQLHRAVLAGGGAAGPFPGPPTREPNRHISRTRPPRRRQGCRRPACQVNRSPRDRADDRPDWRRSLGLAEPRQHQVGMYVEQVGTFDDGRTYTWHDASGAEKLIARRAAELGLAKESQMSRPTIQKTKPAGRSVGFFLVTSRVLHGLLALKEPPLRGESAHRRLRAPSRRSGDMSNQSQFIARESRTAPT
jgi:hypothetical protein